MQATLGGSAAGDWPQRLLHVPTMTSQEWAEGDRYGHAVKPRYCAISYTWGRYSLKEHEQPHVKPIPISGLSWVIPRINETHFTAGSFEKIIRRSVERRNVPANASHSNIEFEFLWLDIACINQTEGHPQKAMEIGRQAKIFRRAKRVFVWLNQLPHTRMVELVSQLTSAADTLRDNQASLLWKTRLKGDESWLETARNSLQALVQDRWFSSLWTLQEAFLAQWAYLISADVEPLEGIGPQLRTIFEATEVIYSACRQSIAAKRDSSIQMADLELDFVALTEEFGLAALTQENPMALYAVASNRQTSRPVDYVYGIMQVFGFRLGVSSPLFCQETTGPNLCELELELGETLLREYPIMSQMHVYTQPAPEGHAWKISRSSIIPDIARKVPYYVTSSFLGDHVALCKLSCKTINGRLWGHFSGKMCRFEALESAWRAIDKISTFAKIINRLSTAQLNFDSTNLIIRTWFSEDPIRDIPRGERQKRLGAEFSKAVQLNGLDVRVLLLGRFDDLQHGDDMWQMSGGPISEFFGGAFNIGLVLIRQKLEALDVWRRVGICIWDISHLILPTKVNTLKSNLAERLEGGKDAPNRHLLEGEGPKWDKMEGGFG